MPDTRRHRGRHPDDARLFSERTLPSLRAALDDLSLLATRGYAEASALKLVGDRYGLTERQRMAVRRSACSDQALAGRRGQMVPADALAGEPVAIDGYNLLITIESALSGGLILVGRDGCLRDLASLHGTYRTVEETLPAARLIGEHLHAMRPAGIDWYLDAPVSNSGRLRALLLEESARNGWDWSITLDNNPDRVLAASPAVAVSSDSWVIDHAGRWTNLADALLRERLPGAEIVRMGDDLRQCERPVQTDGSLPKCL